MGLQNMFLNIGVLFSFTFPIVVATWQGQKPTLVPEQESRKSSGKIVDNFIINGNTASEDDIKSLVSIQVYVDDPDYQYGLQAYEYSEAEGKYVCSPTPQEVPGWFHVCGGALIEREFVLTSAVCVQRIIEKFKLQGYGNLQVAVGYNGPFTPGVAIGIEAFTHHYENDIGLLHLETPANLSKTVKTIKMGSPKENCVVSGWGKTDCGYPSSARSVYLTQTKAGDCKFIWKLYGELAYGKKKQFTVSNKEVCYLGWSSYGEKGLCTGDEGGVLVCDGRVAGVASWFDKQCLGCRPQVFSKLDKQWIKDQILAATTDYYE